MKKLVVSTAIGAGLAFALLRRSRRDERAFREILRGLTVGENPDALLHRIAERAAKLVYASGAYVERIDPARDLIVASAGYGGGLPPV
jgi:hypothetical protein